MNKQNQNYFTLGLFEATNNRAHIMSAGDVLNRLHEYEAQWMNGHEFTVLFDSAYYLSQLSGVTLELTPLEHYINGGYKQFNPNHLFDTQYYLAKYQHVMRHPIPLIDYVEVYLNDELGHRNPSPYFDVSYYLKKNPDVAQSKLDPLCHYLLFGNKERREFHPFLSIEYIRAQLKRTNKAHHRLDDLSLLRFVIDFNLLERFEPSPFFSNGIYRASLRRALQKNPFFDYFVCAISEMGNPNGLFETNYYIQSNPGPNFSVVNPLVHYLCYADRRTKTSQFFDGEAYIKLNPDVSTTSDQPLAHFFKYGFDERRYISYEHQQRFAQGYAAPYVKMGNSTNLESWILPTVNYVFRSAAFPFEQGINISQAQILDVQSEIASFDFWDTIVLRDSPHWCPKLHSAIHLADILSPQTFGDTSEYPAFSRLLSQLGETKASKDALSKTVRIDYLELYKLRIAIEAEFHKDAVECDFTLVFDRLLKSLEILSKRKHKSARSKFVKYLREYELEYEIEFTKPNSHIYLALDKQVARKKEAIIISDYYHDSDYLKEIFISHVGTNKNENLSQIKFEVSCDHGTSKLVNGALFASVKSKLAVANDGDWVHFGDNEFADAKQAHRIGISSVHLSGKFGSKQYSNEFEPSTLDSDTYETWAASTIMQQIDRILTASHAPFNAVESIIELRDSAIAHSAVRHCIYPIVLVWDAIRTAYSKGLSEVLYLSREGQFLSRIHEALIESLPAAYRDIRAVHIESSRRALFGPAFHMSQDDAIATFRSQYPDATLQTLMKAIMSEQVWESVNETMRSRLALIGLRVLENKTLEEVIGVDLFSLIVDQCAEQYDLFVAYLLQKNVLCGVENAVICDIGWRGTMQDLLSMILPEVTISGVYLGLFPFKLEQKNMLEKRAVIFDANEGDDYQHVDPPAAIERSWTPGIGSCVGYRLCDAEIEPVRDSSDCTERSAKDIQLFQDGVIDCVSFVAQNVLRYGITAKAFKHTLSARLQTYYLQPDAGICEIWFGSKHDDTFGSGIDVYKKGIPLPHETSPYNFYFLLDKTAVASRWSPGYSQWSSTQWYKSIFA